MQLNELLEILELSENRGVIFQNENSNWKDVSFFSSEHRNKLEKISPDAVYHFNNQPFLLFFDYQLENKNRESQNKIFKKVWNWDVVPVIFVIDSSGNFAIYNAFYYQEKLDKLQEIKPNKKKEETKNDLLKQFSFWNLQSGGTLTWLEKNIFKKNKKRSNKVLNEKIKTAREHLMFKITPSLNPDFTSLLVLRLIFVRYLIDRNVKINKKYISGTSNFDKKTSFYNTIKHKKQLIAFFEYLKKRFNGSLFDTANDPTIAQIHLNYLSTFFATSADNRQNTFQGEGFDIFDFSIIPVETISGIYEGVIDEKKRKILSAVYTPQFLVDYILNKTVKKHLNPAPKDDKKTRQVFDCKVLDPSCGSGIFLTQTYRRLVENEIQKTGKTPSDKRLIEIATKNLYGIDRDINALHVTAFSIYISILDFKQPADLDNKKFILPNLIGKNLFHNDFFNEEKSEDEIEKAKKLNYHSFNETLSKQKLDFILGNPPWGRKNNKTDDFFHLKYKKNYNLPVTNDEISQSFLFRSKDFHKGECALIVSSKAFYNRSKNKAKDDFKKTFFSNFLVSEFFDLSAARRMVFDDAISPAIVVFYKHSDKKEIDKNVINYNSVKPNRFLKELKTIVIEEQDQKQIQQQHFIDYPWMMKLALYGNTHDFHLLKSLQGNDTLKMFLDNNSDTVFYGDGIKKYIAKQKKKTLEITTKIKRVNFPVFELDEITPYYSRLKTNIISESQIKEIKLWRNINLFKYPKILLKARPLNETDIYLSFYDKKALYREKVLGISSQNKKVLYEIYGNLISKLFAYFQYLTSSAWGVSLPEILQNEALAFPYKECENKEELAKLAKNFIDLFRSHHEKKLLKGDIPTSKNSEKFKILLDKINKIVNETYYINSVQEDMIDYVLDVSRYQFQEGKLEKFLRKPTKQELEKYAQIFYDNFADTYNGEFEGITEYFKVEIFDLGYFTAMKFIITEKEPSENEKVNSIRSGTERDLFKILAENFSLTEINEHSLANDIFIQKNVKGFEADYFYIIKPNEYKSWHKAMAHYDVAWFDNEILKAESELLNQ